MTEFEREKNHEIRLREVCFCKFKTAVYELSCCLLCWKIVVSSEFSTPSQWQILPNIIQKLYYCLWQDWFFFIENIIIKISVFDWIMIWIVGVFYFVILGQCFSKPTTVLQIRSSEHPKNPNRWLLASKVKNKIAPKSYLYTTRCLNVETH